MDVLSFQNHLPLDVHNKKSDGDEKKTEGYIERVDGREYRKDFFNVKSPEDVDQEDDADNG
jgi:hypothetical protein